MSALAAALAIFGSFAMLGLGVTALLPRSFSAELRARLAPGIGIGLYVIMALALSRSGLPARAFSTPLTIVLLVLSVCAIALRPIRLSWAAIAGILGPIGLACILVGSPFVSFGFHWVSYANDDMTNYSLSAQRFQDYGYFDPPRRATFLSERNLGEVLYGLDVADGERTGSNLLLAVAATEFHREPFEIFMPFIFAAFLSIVVGAGALVLTPGGRLVSALISVGVAASPLASFGILYQLLSQEYGLATACSLLGLLLALVCEKPAKTEFIRMSIALGISACGLLAIYPELFPFIGIAIALMILARHRHVDLRSVIGLLSAATVSVALLLNTYALEMLLLIARRLFATSTAGADSMLFPFYLIPSGLDNFWGLQPIATFYKDPDQSVLIAIAIGLCLIGAFASIMLLLLCDTAAAPMLIALITYAIYGAIKHQGFAVYKIAMYSQPFLVATIVGASALFATKVRLRSDFARRVVMIAPILIVAIAWIPTQFYYKEVSADRHKGLGVAFAEIAGASRDRILLQLRQIAKGTQAETVLSDTSNTSLAKIEGGYLTGSSLFFPSEDFFGHFRAGSGHDEASRLFPPLAKVPASFMLVQSQRYGNFHVVSFNFLPNSARRSRARFSVDKRLGFTGTSKAVFLSTNSDLSVLNRRSARVGSVGLSMDSGDRIKNWLTFVNSTFGYAPGPTADRAKISLYQLEPDFYFRGQTMASAGRYLLFRISKPSKAIRLIVDISASLNGDGQNRVPSARAIGTTVASFHALGAGSGRLISDPVIPIIIDHSAFVGVDMGTPHRYFDPKRTGLMLLYGRDTPLDPRAVVGFIRDISAIPASENLSGIAPSHISRFPDDLEAKNLFYSGIYEDGWFGKDVRLRLNAADRRPHLDVRFEVPRIGDANFSSSVEISVDGNSLGTWPCPLGESEVNAPTSLAPGTHDIELHFSDVQRLPGLDGRPVSAEVQAIGFD